MKTEIHQMVRSNQYSSLLGSKYATYSLNILSLMKGVKEKWVKGKQRNREEGLCVAITSLSELPGCAPLLLRGAMEISSTKYSVVSVHFNAATLKLYISLI